VPIGGISSNLKSLRANLFLSSAVALTGIAAPIGLSFALLGLLPITPVQAFAAGAALCSTSLGTTFTVLATSGLTETRLGVVLSSAAMMDDVVGLIILGVIASLGVGSSFNEITVIRPVFVSIALAVLVPLICLFVAKPVTLGVNDYLQQPKNARHRVIFSCSKAAFVYQTSVLLAMITGATYAGTSNLFAAYLAGTSVTWLSDCLAVHRRQRLSSASTTTSRIPDQFPNRPSSHSVTPHSTATNAATGPIEHIDDCSGKAIYERYYSSVVESILRPLFFASIGFAIPITKLFTGRVIWRGLVYAILMVFGKVVCGLWLVRFAPIQRAKAIFKLLSSISAPAHKLKLWFRTFSAVDEKSTQEIPIFPAEFHSRDTAMAQGRSSLQQPSPTRPSRDVPNADPITSNTRVTANTPRKRTAIPRPKSLYPAAILGSAMVSRGEIGFLISSVAEANEVFGEGGNTEPFLIVTWAILLCTLIGPITMGLLVKRVNRLQQAERQKANGHEDPLGIWGVRPPSTTS
jgi:Kef-type K+ transport system membrane component KefB